MDKMIEAICDGFANDILKEKMNSNDARQKELRHILENTEEAPVLLHPRMADYYHKEVQTLIESLNSEDNRQEAAQLIRSLIEKVVLTPQKEENRLSIDLYGDLAGILTISTKDKHSKEELEVIHQQANALTQSHSDIDLLEKDKMVAGGRSHLSLSHNKDKLVAGVGFEPTTFRL